MKWIKLLRDYAGKKAGDLLEVEESIARAYVEAKIAEEAPQAEEALLETAAAELRAQAEQFQADMRREMAEVVRTLSAGLKRPAIQVEAGESEAEKKLRSGGDFKGIGHFATAVRRGCAPSPDADCARLVGDWVGTVNTVTRAVSGMSEGSDPDGAILVPGEMSDRIWERMTSPEKLLPRTNPIPVGGVSLKVPALREDSRANGSRHGGILGYWEGEADQIPSSRPKFRDVEAKLKKLTALVYVTDELLQDARGLEAFLGRVVPKEFDFKVNEALINGNGVGMPKGIRRSQALISVAKESGQAAATLVRLNINKMYNRLHGSARANAVWLANQDVEPQLEELDVSNNNAAVQILYAPPGSGGNELGRLKNKPVILCEHCETIGTDGDILLAAFENYLTIYKGGVMSAVSMHLRFDYGETVFRWVIRIDGQPYEVAPVTPFKGSTTTSSFVSLATRA